MESYARATRSLPSDGAVRRRAGLGLGPWGQGAREGGTEASNPMPPKQCLGVAVIEG